ncbi:MAG: hypothetical protein WDN26_05615 [Chitinophagaceae bacterium]
MNQTATTIKTDKWFLVILSGLQVAAFFIPWVSWNGMNITGADMPLGNFFSISEKNFLLASPFPQFDFALGLLWLIPVLATIVLFLSLAGKRVSLVAAVAGIITLALITIYILVTNELIDQLGVSGKLKIGIYLAILSGAGIIIAGSKGWFKKIVLLIIGPLIAWGSFTAIYSHFENEEFSDTAHAKADYTISADGLIKEFLANDSAANAKYREKIISVEGNISAVEMPNDSTVNVKFVDTATGSYAIFPFVNEPAKEAKTLKEGQAVSIKGSCSGGVYSQILGTEFITFKRCVLNKK